MNFLIDNDLIFISQSRFKPGGLCINQLLSITHDIYKSFDAELEIRGVCLDISKAFDKVWHDELLWKYEQNYILGYTLKAVTNFLYQRKQTGIKRQV